MSMPPPWHMHSYRSSEEPSCSTRKPIRTSVLPNRDKKRWQEVYVCFDIRGRGQNISRQTTIILICSRKFVRWRKEEADLSKARTLQSFLCLRTNAPNYSRRFREHLQNTPCYISTYQQTLLRLDELRVNKAVWIEAHWPRQGEP